MPSLAWACIRVSESDGVPMQSDHRKTRRIYDRNGEAHFITFSCFRRKPLLSKERSCQWMVEAISLSRSKHPFDLWAWVIMPEHIHLVLRPHADVRISSILITMKQSISRRAMLWLKEHNPAFLADLRDQQPNGKSSYRFWQRGGGYDRNLRSTRDVHEKIRYVHENPVRRGLVVTPLEWKWSSATAWHTGRDEPISLDRESVPALTNLDDRLDSRLCD